LPAVHLDPFEQPGRSGFSGIQLTPALAPGFAFHYNRSQDGNAILAVR